MSGDDLVVQPGLVIPGAEIRETASRAGGPGGQHVNKASTRVTLRWGATRSSALGDAQRARLRRRLAARLTREGDLLVHAQATRSRARNRALARARLAALVREGLARPRPRRPTQPSAAARERRLEAKRRRALVKRRRAFARPERE